MTVTNSIEGNLMGTRSFSLLKTRLAYSRTQVISYHHLVRLETHPQASGQGFASMPKWSVIYLCLPLSSREQNAHHSIHRFSSTQLIPVYQMLRRITPRMDIFDYLGCTFQSLVHS